MIDIINGFSSRAVDYNVKYTHWGLTLKYFLLKCYFRFKEKCCLTFLASIGMSALDFVFHCRINRLQRCMQIRYRNFHQHDTGSLAVEKWFHCLCFFY